MSASAAEAFRGSLLTRHFVAHVLAAEFAGRLGESSVAVVRRRCARWMREAHARLGPASSVRAICEVGATPLFARIGYALRTVRVEPQGDVLIAALDGTRGVTLTLVVSPWQERLDRVWRVAVQSGLGARQRWCLCFNGHQLRVVDVDRPYARRFLEFDLRHAVDDERGFRLLWALLRPVAFARSPNGPAAAAPAAAAPALLDQIVAACDAHGGSVREALQHGVRHALASLATALARASRRATRRASHPSAPPSEIVAQALTMIYRLLFLLFAEARALVPIWHPIYRDSYSIGALHALAEGRPEGRTARGLWPAVQAISRLAHDGCDAGDLSVTAFNGQLFAPEHTPLGEHLHITSPIVADVLDALMTTPPRGRRGRERITYADLGVEQLGTVYERVLDYAPHLEREIGEAITRPRDTRSSQDATQDVTQGFKQGFKPDFRQNSTRTMPGGAPIGPLTLTLSPPQAGRGNNSWRQNGASTGLGDTDASREGPAGRSTGRALRRSSARRKESGSFYTPRSMADYLVRVTLGPLVAEASADDILALRVLDPAMGSGAFLVSACRFLAQAHEQACERDGRTQASAFARAAAERAEVRRHLARHCLFGVDLNPMAVQLARLSLWLTTMMRDAPLTFLDHHLRVGDSLVGASLDDLVRRPPSRAGTRRNGRGGRDTAGGLGAAGVGVGQVTSHARRGRRHASAADLPLFSGDEHAHVMRAILPARTALTAVDDSAATVREKERLLQSLAREGALSRWLQLADVWCASWFANDAHEEGAATPISTPMPTLTPIPAPAPTAISASTAAPPPAAAWTALADYLLRGETVLPRPMLDGWLAATRRTAERRRFFHWTLEFPEVFFDEQGQPLGNGGFDAIVGNPPWDMVRNDARDDEGNGERFERETGALSRFVREAGLYVSAGDAHVNCYQLFVERSLALLKRGGRLGLVLPWGIAADHGSARLRRRLLESCDLDTLVSFENNRAIFPIHRSTRFALVTGTTGRPTRAVRCRFGERDPAVLDTLNAGTGHAHPHAHTHTHTHTHTHADDGHGLVVTVDLLRQISGEGLAFPDVRARRDIAMLERLHAACPALTSPDGWHVKFGRELNASDDHSLFAARAATAAAAAAPAPAAGAAEAVAAAPAAARAEAAAAAANMPVVDGKHLRPFAVSLDTITHTVRPDRMPALLARLPDIARQRLAFRDIASPTNRLTLIAAILPAGAVSTHTVSCLKSSLAIEAQWCLCALLNSFVANYLVRMRVSTHVTLALMERLPVPRPLRDSRLFRELADLAEQLSRAETTTADADATQGAHGADGKRGTPGAAYARLQALAARAYGLSHEELQYVLTKFPLIEDETKRATLEAFKE